MTVDVIGNTVALDELENAKLGQGNFEETVISNTAGSSGITLQFNSYVDLSIFNTTDNAVMMLPNYPGGYLAFPNAAYSVTSERGILGQTINAGTIYPTVTMQDSSRIPNGQGLLIFNFGRNNEEAMVKYFGRPNNSSLILDPSYAFARTHVNGDPINLILTPNVLPAIDGSDYSVYLTDIEAARIAAQEIVESIVAGGIVVRWIIISPQCA
jgi:hypothetical protein